MPGLSRDNTIPEFAPKRRRIEEILEDDDLNDEDEAALLAAVEQETPLADAEKPKAAQAIKRNEPELSEGVMAALAKFREQG